MQYDDDPIRDTSGRVGSDPQSSTIAVFTTTRRQAATQLQNSLCPTAFEVKLRARKSRPPVPRRSGRDFNVRNTGTQSLHGVRARRGSGELMRIFERHPPRLVHTGVLLCGVQQRPTALKRGRVFLLLGACWLAAGVRFVDWVELPALARRGRSGDVSVDHLV